MDLTENKSIYVKSLYIILLVLINFLTPLASTESGNQSTTTTTEVSSTTQSVKPGSTVTTVTDQVTDAAYLQKCPYNASCSDLGGDCISCTLNHYCVYGSEPSAECTVKPNITCIGEKTFNRQYHCRYAYQLDKTLYYCNTAMSICTMKKAPPMTFFSQCLVRDDVLCLGNRSFYKKFPCNWTRGYKWSTALVLSVTLGGFGVDRFYLGLWREGIGKLFSFGGLGVWTLVDVILIAIGYVGPHDGSLYIYPWS